MGFNSVFKGLMYW